MTTDTYLIHVTDHVSGRRTMMQFRTEAERDRYLSQHHAQWAERRHIERVTTTEIKLHPQKTQRGLFQ